MNAVGVIASITFREAARKKILWTALVVGIGFLAVFGAGLHYQMADLRTNGMAPFLRYQVLSATLMIGLYTVDLLAVVMTILTSVDTISGEIGSGTIQAIATKPVARWQILVGKWAGFVTMLGIYVGLMFGGTLAVGYWIAGVVRDCAWVSWAGVPRRLAGTDERLCAGFRACDAWRGVECDHANGGDLAAGRISDAASFGRRIAILTIREHLGAERSDGGICRRLSAGRACGSDLSFPAARSVGKFCPG